MTVNPWRGIVRTADASEEDDIMALCRELHAENGLHSMDDDLVRIMLRRAFGRQGGVIGVIGKPGALEAIIYLVLTNHWASKDSHIEELFAFVRPEYRTSSHAETLINFARDCSTNLGIPLVIGIVTNKRTAAKVRLYRRVLGYPAGAYFVVNGAWKSAPEPLGENFWKGLDSKQRGGRDRHKSRNGATETVGA